MNINHWPGVVANIVPLSKEDGSYRHIFPLSNTHVIDGRHQQKAVVVKNNQRPAIWKQVDINKQGQLFRFRDDTRLCLWSRFLIAQFYSYKTQKWIICTAPTECVNWVKLRLDY